MKRCVSCLVPKGAPNTYFDSKGVCNHCNYWKQVGPELSDMGKWKKVFENKINAIKGKYKYDVAVAMGGGKDGSYLAYALKEEYNLRVLAFTIDFGHTPNEFAKKNLRRIVDNLGIDHVMLTFPEGLMKKVFHNYLTKPFNLSPCYTCGDTLCYLISTKFAVEHQVPKVAWGFDRGQMFGNLFSVLFEDITVANLSNQWKKNVEMMVEERKTRLINLGLTASERSYFEPVTTMLPGTSETPEHLAYFLYHPYNEEKIKQVLVEKLNWERPTGDDIHGHFDCKVKNAVAFAQKSLGVGGALDWELSADIREGNISREQALRRVEKEYRQTDEFDHAYKQFEDLYGVSEDYLLKKTRRLRKIIPILCYFSKIKTRFDSMFGRIRTKEAFSDNRAANIEIIGERVHI